jgi:hypothetical protein
MSGFICGADRSQGTMFPVQLEDYVAQDNPVRVIDFLSISLIFGSLVLAPLIPRRREGQPIIPR